MRRINGICRASIVTFVVMSLCGFARGEQQWVVYAGGDGPGKGKHIVLISGDEEYRSEEGLPQLAKILAKHHGFQCTVLFALGKDGTINPIGTTTSPASRPSIRPI